MRKLSLIIGVVHVFLTAIGQENPHGKSLTIDCLDCHTTESWEYNTTGRFDHSSADFILDGQHTTTNCRSCHTSLVFSDAGTTCIDCHTDMHNTTVGPDCDRCHDTRSWIVTNTTEIHQLSRFPLLGAHRNADCIDCHTSVSLLEFVPLGIDCYECHQEDYLSTTSPNHLEADLSNNCEDCHRMDDYSWEGADIDHSYFPLTLGHDIIDCAECHTSTLTAPITADCYSCHEQDFTSSTMPSHLNDGFTIQCEECHTTNPGWNPAEFRPHDESFFPVYSGQHAGEWISCMDCHTIPNNYSSFSCIDCHEHNQSETDSDHLGIPGYSWNSQLCLTCHPTGDSESSFNHNTTSFPLTGAHLVTDCISCHTTGYAGTSTLCSDCHQLDYNTTTNPNHAAAQFTTDCEVCHSATAWEPSTFDHDLQYFPIYTGAHWEEWSSCLDCHTQAENYSVFSCTVCHEHNQVDMDDKHKDVNGYDYSSPSCLDCHPNGRSGDA